MSAALTYGPAWLTAPVVPLAWCWRISRCDGVTIGMTTHDAPIRADGLTYQPAPGMRPSAIRQRRGLGGDSFEIEGALSATAISEVALSAGRWDGARLTLSVVDWQQPDATALVIAEGALGGVTSDGRQFTAALDGRDAWLNGAVVPETSAECRAELGDAQCRVAMSARSHSASLVSLTGVELLVSGSFDADIFPYGRVRWIDGPARGLSALIVAQAGALLTLADVPLGAGVVGERVELIEGCDKRAATCAARFANIANFRGEPHLPGMDLLTRFPGG